MQVLFRVMTNCLALQLMMPMILKKLVGDYYIVDFNGDGIVDNKDQAPYGYTNSPENTFNATVGFEWKGFSAFAQFYGVTNVTRDVALNSFGSKLNTVFDNGTWWSKSYSQCRCSCTSLEFYTKLQ